MSLLSRSSTNIEQGEPKELHVGGTEKSNTPLSIHVTVRRASVWQETLARGPITPRVPFQFRGVSKAGTRDRVKGRIYVTIL
jgi:hypothetical protein